MTGSGLANARDHRYIGPVAACRADRKGGLRVGALVTTPLLCPRRPALEYPRSDRPWRTRGGRTRPASAYPASARLPVGYHRRRMADPGPAGARWWHPTRPWRPAGDLPTPGR